MINYMKICGRDKRLNEIVFPGSHDAGITAGRKNVKTQEYNVGRQAQEGVRLFDIRVKSTFGDARTYHGTMFNPAIKSKMGAWGEGLSRILRESRDFVETGEGKSEFLILKFDKCEGFKSIASECIETLGDCLFKGTGSLNTKQLNDVKGKVIVVFSEKGAAEAIPYTSEDGIFKFLSVTSGNHDPLFPGLQYVGKGGTNPLKANGEWTIFKASKQAKIDENYAKQNQLMTSGRSMNDPDLMGMMYWTTTGLFQSIKERNNLMWQQEGRQKLRDLWGEGIEDAIFERIRFIQIGDYSSGATLKRFIPNIVMIDFANEDKCKTISELNTLASTSITEFIREHHGFEARPLI